MIFSISFDNRRRGDALRDSITTPAVVPSANERARLSLLIHTGRPTGRIEVAAKAGRKIIINAVGTRQESAVVLYHRGN